MPLHHLLGHPRMVGDFQLIELAAQFFPFGIEPREPLGNPLLLLFHQRSHFTPDSPDDTVSIRVLTGQR